MIWHDFIRRSAGVGLLIVLVGIVPAGAQTLTLQGGGALTLDNGSTLDLGSATMLVETGGGRVTGGSGTLTATRTLSAPDGANVAGLGLAITSAADLETTTVTRGHVVQTAGSHEGVARYYELESTSNAELNATLVFHYTDAELNGLDEDSLRLYRSDDGGTSWTERDGPVDPAANTVAAADVTPFARWTAASSEAPLPVELTAFEAVRDGDAVHLSWQTASETDNAGFEIQERENGGEGEWQNLGFVEGAGTTGEPQGYAFTAEGLDVGTYAFRLKQVDRDGTAAYSAEVEVTLGLEAAYRLSKPAPNPTRGTATMKLTVREPQHVRVTAYDALGRRVTTLYDGDLEAHHAERIRFVGRRLPSGPYFLRATGETFTATRRVTLVR